MSAVCQWILWILASCFIYSPNTRGMINTYAASIGRYLAFGDLFSAIVLSVEIGYPGSKVYCYYFLLLSLTVLLINFYGHNCNDGYYFYVKYIRDQGHIYTVLILVCLSFCLSFCLWLPANFWVVENVEECQDFIWWIMKKNGRESSRLLIKFKVNLNTKIKLVTVIGVDILWTYCNLFLIRKFCCVLFISTQK